MNFDVTMDSVYQLTGCVTHMMIVEIVLMRDLTIVVSSIIIQFMLGVHLMFCGGEARIYFYIREHFAFLGVLAFGNLLERRTLGRRPLSVEDVHVKDNILAKSYPITLTIDWRICY